MSMAMLLKNSGACLVYVFSVAARCCAELEQNEEVDHLQQSGHTNGSERGLDSTYSLMV